MRILLIFICLLPHFAFGRIVSEEPQNYMRYHEQINEAESCISIENFQEALNIYDEVFNNYDFVFLRDYKIAAQLALHLNQNEKAFQIIKKGISTGLTMKSIKKDKYLSKLKNEPQWESIKEAYPELQKKYFERIDDKTRKSVQHMFKRDQRKAFGALFRIGEKAQEKYYLKKFAPHSELQLKQVIEILDLIGYPGEQLIGNDYWMSTIIGHHNSISLEYSKKDTLYNFIKPKLIIAIKRGEISPYEYALINDWRIAVISNRTQTGYGFLSQPSDSTLIETNKLRLKIGLRTVELRNKLIDIEKKTGMNFYLPDWVDGKIHIK